MKQLVHIHGGEWFDSYEDYWDYLVANDVDGPHQDSIVKWRDRYEEFLGSDWQIIRPQMPSPRNAKYKEWKLWFEKYFQYIKDDVTLVGHSLGATFLAQYLSGEIFPKTIHSLHLVSPAFEGLGGFGLDDVSKINQQAKNVYIYHSKDDPLVPFEDSARLHTLLPDAELVSFEDRGHMLIPEFPELIERIKS